MTPQIAFTLTILLVSLAVMAVQRLRPELTALLVTLALIIAGVLSPTEAFSAFGQPVIIIVPTIFIIGRALNDTGVAAIVARQLLRVGNKSRAMLMLSIMLTAGLLSAVLSSLLVIAALLPAVVRIAKRAKLAPSQLLMPLAAAATMGSLLTLIGAVSNLVASDALIVSGGQALGFFSLTPYGVASLGLVIVWYLLTGKRLLRRLMPAETSKPSLEEVERSYKMTGQLHRLRVRSASDLIGYPLGSSDLSETYHLNVIAVQSADGKARPARPDSFLEQDDLLIVDGPRGNIFQAAARHALEAKGRVSLDEFNLLEDEELRLAEVMVPFRSRLVGKTLAEARFRELYGLNVLAVHRQNRPIRQDLPHLRLNPGDTLLLQGPVSCIKRVGNDLNLIQVTDLGPESGDLVTRKAGLTAAILGVMLLLVVSGTLSLATASLAATLALILSGCITLDRAYQSIDWRTVIVIGGMFPLAMALEKTGAAQLIAQWMIGLTPSIGSSGALLLLYFFTALVTQVVSNSVTAALIVPIAVSLATAQNMSPQPFVIAVAIAATASYLTPITNADNLLIRRAGQYTMRDYLINGLPIFILQTVMVMMILPV
ncbi:MAG TPA: SLC13 family permease [Anaerolineae bacterium]|nr:SLC13 family permease [Anaerolineae bacterium]